VLIAGIVAFIAMLPLAALAPNYINYSSSANTVPNSQSAQVQSLLASSHPEDSTLFVVTPSSASGAAFCSHAYNFTVEVGQQSLSNYNLTSSVCSAGARLIDTTYGPNASLIRGTRANMTFLASAIYGYPSNFTNQWEHYGFTRASINATFNQTGGTTGYDTAFKTSLFNNYSSSQTPYSMVDGSVRANALPFFNTSSFNESATIVILLLSSVTDYSTAPFINLETSAWLSLFGGMPVPPTPQVVAAFVAPGDPGWNYVVANGYSFVPAAIRAQFVSPDSSTQILDVIFNVPDTYRGPSNFYPAQAATPEVRNLATRNFGPSAGVTGAGAITYDTAALTASSDFLFALTFVFLAIAVLITLRSLWAPLLTVLFVVLGFIIGYAAIFATGLVFGSVDYLVTYTLEAVTLGIVTDYLVFLLYRYREELRNGVEPPAAIERATETAGFAILTSALIVAVGLGILSFIPGLRSWGLVLFTAVILIGIAEALFLPVVTSYIGPKIFIGRYLKGSPAPIVRSPFYRGAALAIRRRGLVIAIVILVAVPALIFTFTAPTSYNVAQGLPSSLPSVAAQDQISSAFGSNLLYPTYVLVAAPSGSSFLEPNGSLNPTTSVVLRATAGDLVNQSGVSGANGPFVVGNRTVDAVQSAATLFVFTNGTQAYYLVYLTNDPFSLGAMGTIQDLRQNGSWLVGGLTASLLDQKGQNDVVYPIVEIALVILIAVILGVAFRSLSYPLISISGVFVSISVTVVLLYWISEYLLHQVMIYLIPLILIVILLSLGNDYTVFILSRVAEERRTAPKPLAIPRGIAHSGAVVTSLGLILAVSLGSLGLQPISFLEQLGVAFAISLVIDTFLIRIFYFPAAISLFSRK
jgi:RND superfamily putative drug exporter